MPLGLNRVGGYLHGFPITLPHNFGTQIIEPHDFGNPAPPTTFGNLVSWNPSPRYFGNPVPYPPTTYPDSPADY